MSAYRDLERHFERIGHLEHVAAITGWDEAAMMPAGGGAARGAALATLQVVMHDLLVDDALEAIYRAVLEASREIQQSSPPGSGATAD